MRAVGRVRPIDLTRRDCRAAGVRQTLPTAPFPARVWRAAAPVQHCAPCRADYVSNMQQRARTHRARKCGAVSLCLSVTDVCPPCLRVSSARVFSYSRAVGWRAAGHFDAQSKSVHKCIGRHAPSFSLSWTITHSVCSAPSVHFSPLPSFVRIRSGWHHHRSHPRLPRPGGAGRVRLQRVLVARARLVRQCKADVQVFEDDINGRRRWQYLQTAC